MRRRAVAWGLAIGLLVGIAAAVIGAAAAGASAASRASASAPAPHASARASARLFVNAKEFSLILSRQSIRSGTARIQLYNGGEDAHDLRLRRAGGTRSLRIAATAPGDVAELRAMLRSGRWKLWCSLPGHARAGMRATLTVRKS